MHSYLKPAMHFTILILLLSISNFGQDRNTTAASVQYDTLSINNIKIWIGNNGISGFNPVTESSGFYWPESDNKSTLIYSDGFIWGGKVNGKVYVGGNTHISGLKPVLHANPRGFGIWKLSKVREIFDSVYHEYCYENWPGKSGAPFIDADNDGKYIRGIDKPLVLGDEMIWFAANDSDTAAVRNLFGSDPIGIEIHSAIYAYNRSDELGDVIFSKYKIINKSNNIITDMYLARASDPDIGYHNDDYVGCDTLLNLVYAYNGDNDDEGFYGMNPPAVGYLLLQGPIIPSPNDSALFNGRYISGKKNLRMYAFNHSRGISDPLWGDPEMDKYEGTLQMYNQLQGLHGNGANIINDSTGLAAKFCFPGDPVNKAGWCEGSELFPHDYSSERKILLSTGPFNMAPTDTQEIVIAIIAARGSDNLNSITELKKKVKSVHDFYSQQNNPGTDEHIKLTFNLYQNYPNPFNPETTIIYSLKENSHVELKVFDVLGKEVITLENSDNSVGHHEVKFNAANYSSGIYYYQLKTDNFLNTKKMILIK